MLNNVEIMHRKYGENLDKRRGEDYTGRLMHGGNLPFNDILELVNIYPGYYVSKRRHIKSRVFRE